MGFAHKIQGEMAMQRRGWWYRGVAAVLTTAILLSSGGCVEVFTTAAYLINGTDVGAIIPDLRARRSSSSAVRWLRCNIAHPKELADRVGAILAKTVSGIKVVDQQKVAAWTDENNWQEYPEVGKALGADMVLAIDLTSFSTYQGPTLYQGKATASIKVYDLKDDDKVAWQVDLPQVLYPHNVAVPIAEKSENDFRSEFTASLAERIARYFHSHDPHADMADDARAFN